MRGSYLMENTTAVSLVPQYKLTELSFENKFIQIFRALDSKDKKVILKLIRPKYDLVFDAIDGRHLKQEYDIVRKIPESPYIIRFKAILEHDGVPFGIVEEDDESRPLIDGIPRGGHDVKTFLEIAVQIVQGLKHVHSHNVMHKDIKPSNIVQNYKTSKVKLIDFGSASQLKEELSNSVTNVAKMGGTLGYISPEQTGRMNRPIDFRTDFYSLGVTFYHLLAGELPFKGQDADAIIRAHLATLATPLYEIRPGVPRTLSDLVGKLMSKNTDDRYQSDSGILHDLELIQANPKQDFKLAQQDFSMKLQISQNFFGRKKEVKTLLDSFERVCNTGKPEVILVSGFPGIGKSMLINEVQRPIAVQDGKFISGKYDFMTQTVAYSAISQALQLFVRQILGEGDATIVIWKKKLLEALEDKAQLLVDLIPQLEIVLGKQPAVPALDPLPSKERFQLVFGKFLRVLAGDHNHPLILFLDDLQWADLASIDIIKNFMSSANEDKDIFFLLIGAFRDNEAESEHPALILFDDLKKAQVSVKSIALGPLDSITVQQWIAFSFGSSIQYIRPLAEIVYQKTQGNPFFVKMLLQSLNDEGYLTFSKDVQQWVWDIDALTKAEATENVVDFLTKKMSKFSDTTRQVLFVASCLGHHFSLDKLAIILPQFTIDDLLEELKTLNISGMTYQMEENIYFAHDRIREAAFQLFGGEHKKRTHLDIARHFYSYFPLDKQPHRVFDIVDHYNAAYKHTLMEDKEEMERVITLNIQASLRARNAVAFTSALSYVSITLDHMIRNAATEAIKLQRDPLRYLWDKEYDRMYYLYLQKAELELILSNTSSAETTIATLTNNAKTAIEKAEACVILINIYTVQGKNEKSIQISKDALKMIGFELPDWDHTVNFDAELKSQIQFITEDWGKRGSIQDILKTKHTTDRTHVAVQKLLSAIFMALFIHQHNDVYYLVVAKAVNYAISTGYTSESSLAFAFYSGILCENPDTVEIGNEFGKMALNLIDNNNDIARKCNVYCTVAMLSYHWIKPLRECEQLCHQAYQYGIDSCEAVFIPFTRFLLGVLYFVQGRNLHNLIGECTKLLDFCKKRRCLTSTNVLRTIISTAKILTGEKKWKLSKQSKHVEFLRKHEITSALASEYVFKSQVFYRFGQFGEALKCSMEADAYLSQSGTTLIVADHNFYRSLSLAALIRNCANKKDKRIVDFTKQLLKNQRALEAWSKSCPENFLHKYQLVQGEISWIEGKLWEASDYFEKSIKSAKQNGFVQDEALACEISGIFWILHERETFACMYLNNAISCYTHWGATSKANSLKDSYRTIIYSNSVGAANAAPRFHANSDTSTSFTGSKSQYSTDYTHSYQSSRSGVSNQVQLETAMDNVLWDMENVIKASQTISSGIDLDKILYNMMNIIVTTAGAQKGALLLNVDGNLSVQAEFLGQGQIVVSQGTALDKWEGPHNVIQYVQNTGQAVILANAIEDQQFRRDPYITKGLVKSVLCMPIMSKDEVDGVLYVENNEVNNAFTQQRETVLTILTTQMAISLDNARLVRSQLEEQRKRVLDAEDNKIKLEEFIDTICHEMRNPLNGIYGGVTLLQDEFKLAQSFREIMEHSNLNEQFRSFIENANEQIETINKCAEQQKVIVNDVLDLSKLESNKIQLNPTRFNFKSIINNVIQMCSPQAKRSHLRIVTKIAEGLSSLVADPHRLSQILINILSNAVKFTKQGDIEIEAKIERLHEKEVKLLVSIKDSGIGMTDEEQLGLFNRFGQAGKHISSEYGGSGLGLVICKKLIERMGGNIIVKSTKGSGSTFSFFIRCELWEEGNTMEDHVDFNPMISVSSSEAPASSNYNILVVEDNLMNQRVLTNYLKQRNYLSEIANNGLEALEKFERFHFDLIFLDIEMPVMGGLEAARKIRMMEEDNHRKRVPIVGLSGNARSAQIEEAMSCGFDNYITKPFHRDEIYSMLDRYMNLKS